MSFKIIRTLDRDHCVATWDRVLIQVWRGAVTHEAVRDLERVAQTFLNEGGAKKISSVSLVERSSPAPTDEVRGELSKFYRELAPNAHEAIVVAEGSGFRGALVRGVGVTLSMLAPRALPFKFVGSIPEATAAIAPHLTASAGGASGLQAALEEVRSELDRLTGVRG